MTHFEIKLLDGSIADITNAAEALNIALLAQDYLYHIGNTITVNPDCGWNEYCANALPHESVNFGGEDLLHTEDYVKALGGWDEITEIDEEQTAFEESMPINQLFPNKKRYVKIKWEYQQKIKSDLKDVINSVSRALCIATNTGYLIKEAPNQD